jgi:glutathione synthase/RimK-type ligase-like ATP-grasp enzyme
MILVCGSAGDDVVRYVCSSFQNQKFDFNFVDLTVYPFSFQLFWERNGKSVKARLSSEGWSLPKERVTGAFVRFPDLSNCQLRADLPTELKAALLTENNLALEAVFESINCPVINSLAGVLSNQSKPYQALIIQDSGFRIPSSIVTDDLRECRQFVELCGGLVIGKPMHSSARRVCSLNLKDIEKYDRSQSVPLFLQEIIPGDDIRVHTVGERCFALRICSPELDYHEVEKQNLRIEPTTLPKKIENACIQLAHRLDLRFAGIDLKEAPNGEYYCFEANPSPAFPFYELAGKQPIAAEIGQILSKGG